MIYQRKEGAPFTLDVRWKGFERIQLSTGTTRKKRAESMLRTLEGLKDAGRRDIFSLLAKGRLSLADVHDEWSTNRESLEHRVAKAQSPALKSLLDEWYEWLEDTGTVSAKSRRPYAERTITRYKQSWQKLLAVLPGGVEVLPGGAEPTISTITEGFIAEYRRIRKAKGTQPGTINRDLGALQTFLTWVAVKKGLKISRFPICKEREPDGRERWLTGEEITRFHAALDPAWWPLFCFLLYTGARIGEAQGLRWSDVNEESVSINNRSRRLKTNSSTRHIPLPETLCAVLHVHKASVNHSHADPVFPGALGDYRSARRAFLRAVKAAPLDPCTIHDLRHTYGVHYAESGRPIARLQKILGHSTPAMTMRYMAHAPESHFADDAAAIDASMNGRLTAKRERGHMLLKVV